FDTKILKKVVALRKKDEQERMEEEAILDTYLPALGMIEAPPEG
ncbi:GapR family DNA-binding domain-containing protein, partial [Rhizobium ruizarguesonis]